MGPVTMDDRPRGGALRKARESQEVRREFPYHWDADDLVARRELLRLAVLTSGALFAATVAIAVRGAFGGKTHVERKAIIKASEVPPGTAHYFNYPGSEDQAVLINIPGQGFVAYSQKCTHLSCAVRYEASRSRLFCPCHDGVFSITTGDPTAGPPQRRLPRILVEQQGDTLFATERVL